MTLQRYLTRLIWACTLPLLLLSALLAVDRWREQRAKDEAGAAYLLQSAVRLVDDNLHARLVGLQTLAASPLLDDPADWPAFRLEARGYLAAFGNHVALIDRERRTRLHTMVAVGDAPPPAPRPAGRSAVALALAGGVAAVGDLFDGTVAQEPMAGLAAPVLREGRAVYAVGSVIPLRQLQRLLAELPTPPGWSVTLADSQGRLLARHGGVSQPGDDDDDFRVSGPLQSAPWTLEVRTLHELTVHGRRRMAALLATLVLGTLVAAWLGGWLASRRLARSVRSLSEPPGAPPAPQEIVEIRKVRHTIDDAYAQRDRIEAERRESEQRYREQLERGAADLQMRQAQLRSILDSASDAIIVVDAGQSIVMANAAALRFFGSPGQLIVSAELGSLFPQQLRQPQCEAIAAAVASHRADQGSSPHLELLGLRADGSEFPIEAAVSAVPLPGAPLATVILRDVSEARHLQAELRASQTELRSLMAEHHRVEDRERRRIARELHDELQQVLVAIKIHVASIDHELAADPQRLAPLVQRIDGLASTAVTSTRRIVNDLRPLMLEELGLLPALQALCRQFQERTGIATRVQADDAAWPRVSEQIEICLYRVAQESLTNVAKHSGATQVELRLTAGANGQLSMQLRDNGRGLHRDGRRSPLAFGLKGMTERVRALGGSLHIESAPAGGTVVVVQVNHRPDAPDA
jgi:PAS domain S-box-containing protein